MLDEKAKRRPECDLVNSAPVRLADGQEWLLPRPMLELRAVFRDGKAVNAYPVRAYDPEIDALIEALGECQDDTALLCGAATLGAWLLAKNYDLADEDLDVLFAGRPDDPESWNWVQEVMAIATSRDRPKVSAVG